MAVPTVWNIYEAGVLNSSLGGWGMVEGYVHPIPRCTQSHGANQAKERESLAAAAADGV